MAKVTDFKCIDLDGKDIACDAFGNNVAIGCPNCGYPILAITLLDQRGSSERNPACCRKCGFKCWIEIHGADTLRIHRGAE